MRAEWGGGRGRGRRRAGAQGPNCKCKKAHIAVSALSTVVASQRFCASSVTRGYGASETCNEASQTWVPAPTSLVLSWCTNLLVPCAHQLALFQPQVAMQEHAECPARDAVSHSDLVSSKNLITVKQHWRADASGDAQTPCCWRGNVEAEGCQGRVCARVRLGMVCAPLRNSTLYAVY